MLSQYYLIEERPQGLDSLIRLSINAQGSDVVVTATYLMPHNYGADYFTATYLPQFNQIQWGADFILVYKARGLGGIMLAELIKAVQELAPGAGSSKLLFTAPPHADNDEDNWERRDRFYRSAGFLEHH